MRNIKGGRMSDHVNVADADMPLYGALGMTFMQFPQVQDLNKSDAEVIVSGVPFDIATSGRSGARLGPEGIRHASVNLIWEGARWPWKFALEDHLNVEDIGNVLYNHGEPQSLVENLQAHISQILKSREKPTVIWGGSLCHAAHVTCDREASWSRCSCPF